MICMNIKKTRQYYKTDPLCNVYHYFFSANNKINYKKKHIFLILIYTRARDQYFYPYYIIKDNLEHLLLAREHEAGPSRFYFQIFIDIIFGDRAHDRKVSRTGFKAMQVFFEQRAETRGRATSHTKLSRVSRAFTVSDVRLLLIYASCVLRDGCIDVIHVTLTNVFHLFASFKVQINTENAVIGFRDSISLEKYYICFSQRNYNTTKYAKKNLRNRI